MRYHPFLETEDSYNRQYPAVPLLGITVRASSTASVRCQQVVTSLGGGEDDRPRFPNAASQLRAFCAWVCNDYERVSARRASVSPPHFRSQAWLSRCPVAFLWPSNCFLILACLPRCFVKLAPLNPNRRQSLA